MNKETVITYVQHIAVTVSLVLFLLLPLFQVSAYSQTCAELDSLLKSSYKHKAFQVANEFALKGINECSDNIQHDFSSWKFRLKSGLCYMNLRQQEESAKAFHSVLDQCDSVGFNAPLCNTCVRLSRNFRTRIGDLGLAIRADSIHCLRVKLESGIQSIQYAEALLQMGVDRCKGHPVQGMADIEKALEIIQQDTVLVANSELLLSASKNCNQLEHLTLALELVGLGMRAIPENKVGRLHQANLYNERGAIYWKQGEAGKAIQDFRSAAQMVATEYGKEHLNYANALTNLSRALWSLGLFEEAENIVIEAGLVYKKNSKSNIRCLKHHAAIASSLQQTDFALDLLDSAIVIAQKDQDSLELAYIHLDKANMLLELGEVNGASEVLELCENLLLGIGSKNSIDLIKCRIKKARCLLKQERYAESRELAISLINELGRKDGPVSLQLAILNDVIARSFAEKNELDLALKYFTVSNNLRWRFTTLTLDYLLQDERKALIKFTLAAQHYQNELVAKHDKLDPGYTQLLLDNSLRYNAILLRSQTTWKRSLRSDGDALVKELFEEWNNLTRKLARESLKYPEDRAWDINWLSFLRDSVEAKLLLQKEVTEQPLEAITLSSILDHLGASETAIQFCTIPHHSGDEDSTLYGAILVNHSMKKPKLVKLFSAYEVNPLLYQDVERRADYVHDIYSLNPRSIRRNKINHRTLKSLVVDPLSEYIEGSSTIIYAPSGILHRLNLSAIELEMNTAWSDRYSLRRRSSLNSFLYDDKHAFDKDAVLLGFGETYADEQMLNSVEDSSPLSDRIYYPRGHLPYSKSEVTEISLLLEQNGYKTTLLLNEHSDELSLARSLDKSPAIVHLACHAYFHQISLDNQVPEGVSLYETSDDPFLRSGLILNEANAYWNDLLSINDNDGVLTAMEASTIDLSNTKLTVLSACETGLGDIDPSEGIFGLQRAFLGAGSEYLLMSLWQVSDKSSEQFMRSFYEKWIVEANDIEEAFEQAQQEMKRANADPYFWAGFELIK
jgi:CHAT domain-containing protein